MLSQEVPLKEKNIVFIGFMGVGKTTIGKRVAKILDRNFIDIDEEIEKEFSMPVSDIFKKIGEKEFREREKTIITRLSGERLHIISVGGGAFLQEEIRDVCLSNSIVFFIDLSFEGWKDRIPLIIESRPVLQGKSMEEMQELYAKRQEIYSQYHFKVKTDQLTIDQISNSIVDSLKSSWEMYDQK